MNNRLLSNALGLVLIASIGATSLALFRPGALLPTTNAAVPQSLAAPANADADVIAGNYAGQATLKFTLGGVYSDTLATPTPSPTSTTASANVAEIDLSLFLSQNGSLVNGYVNLDKTLVFSAEHTIQATPVGITSVPGQATPAPSALVIGPTVQGTFDGTNLNVQSEKVSMVVSGRAVQRQFRITGTLKPGDANTLIGEYRETLWGYGPQPLTVIGTFAVTRYSATSTSGTNTAVIQTVADSAITKQGVAVTLNVLTNDTAANGGTLTIISVSKPQHGTATFTVGGTVTYTPSATFAGVETFSYVVSDGKGGTAVGSVNITVIGPVYLPLVVR